MANTGGDTFIETDRYVKLLFQLGKDVLPTEMNEWQDILRVMLARYIQSTFGEGTLDNGLFVIPTPATGNSVTFKAGSYSRAGQIFILPADVVIPPDNYLPSPKTPTSTRTDRAYVKLFESEVTAVDDPALIQFSELGEETTRRRKLNVEFFVDTSVPVSDVQELWEGGVKYEEVAVINRAAGVDQIAALGITDTRKIVSFLDNNIFNIEHVTLPSLPDKGRHRKVTALEDQDIVIAVDPTAPNDRRVIFRSIGAGDLEVRIELNTGNWDFVDQGSLLYSTGGMGFDPENNILSVTGTSEWNMNTGVLTFAAGITLTGLLGVTPKLTLDPTSFWDTSVPSLQIAANNVWTTGNFRVDNDNIWSNVVTEGIQAVRIQVDPTKVEGQYRYKTPGTTFGWSMGPVMGGWTSLDNPATVRLAYDFAGVTPNITGSTLTIRRPIHELLANAENVSVAGNTVVLSNLKVSVLQDNSSVVTVTLYKKPRHSLAAAGTVGIPATFSDNAGIQTTQFTLSASAVEQDHEYFLEATLNASAAIADCKILDVEINGVKLAVE